MNDDVGSFTKNRYILKHEDDFVERVEATEWATVPSYFVFTKDRAKAKIFTYQDLYWKQATNPIGIQFSQGFSRGEVIRVDNEPEFPNRKIGVLWKEATRETSPTETLYEQSVRETPPTGALDPDLAKFASDLIASKNPSRADLETALVQLRKHPPVVGRGKLIVALCLKLGEEE